MDGTHVGERLLKGRARGALLSLVSQSLYQDAARRFLVPVIDHLLRDHTDKNRRLPAACREISRQRMLIALAVLHTVDRLVGRRQLSPRVARVSLELWARALLVPPGSQPSARRFRQEHGCDPPWFITVSPGHACNLRCTGCYADTGVPPSCPDGPTTRLSWSMLDRIIAEAKQLWGIPLVVVSGGEPLAYHSEGKDVLDIVEKHSDCLFLMFTNGTLIDAQTAARMARVGNLTPAISVEGLAGHTEERRGPGVFNRILGAMAYLRDAGVPFGVSATVTRQNCEETLSDRFLDFFFSDQGAFYGFLFQYMPIGRSPTLDWMPTPQQRIDFWRRSWEVVEKKRVFLFDFWNFGPLVGGCVSAGREGGYIYVDWSGKVMPCVFMPYAVANIHEVYAGGGTLDDVWNAPFFQGIRQWQRDYGYGQPDPRTGGNWLRPCPIRDHHGMFRELLERYAPDAEDKPAREALQDNEYYEGLVAYGMEFGRLSQRVWDQQYCGEGQ